MTTETERTTERTRVRLVVVDIDGGAAAIQQAMTTFANAIQGQPMANGKHELPPATAAAAALPAPVASRKPQKNKGGRPKKITSPATSPTPATSPKGPVNVSDDRAAFDVGVLLKRNGRMRSDGIRNGTGIEQEQLIRVLQRPWFEKAGGCWTLSADGHAHFQPPEAD